MGMIVVIGGSGSGKSAYAEKRISELNKDDRFQAYYLATMQVFGEEELQKIRKHKNMRRGKGFVTVEKPRDIYDALQKIQPEKAAVLLECVSNLAANEMFYDGYALPEDTVVEKVINGITILKENTDELVAVTNNIFEDGVHYDETSKAYIRALGRINRKLAEMADEVVEVVAGIPVILKSGIEKNK